MRYTAEVPHAPLVALAAAVDAFMVRHGETQEVFAARFGWSQNYLSGVLHRLRTASVDWPTAEKLAAVVGHELRLVKVRQK